MCGVGTMCGHEFCWGCLVDYSDIINHGNQVHAEVCLHYRAVDVAAVEAPEEEPEEEAFDAVEVQPGGWLDG
jgi:hypothetical protein